VVLNKFRVFLTALGPLAPLVVLTLCVILYFVCVFLWWGGGGICSFNFFPAMYECYM
jgi:hypothetical protein